MIRAFTRLRRASFPLALLPAASLLAQAPPPNGSCGTAQAIPGAGPFPYSTTVDTTGGSLTVASPAHICNAKEVNETRSVWFTFTPSVTDNYQIDTLGSTPIGEYDTIVSFYSGTCGNLVPLANGCNDDTVGSLQSVLALALNADTTYMIQVSGLGGRDPFNPFQIVPSSGGKLKLNVKRVPINYPYRYVVPSVAHVGGLALYVSNLNVTNVDSADGAFVLQFLGHGKFGDQNPPPSQPTLSPISIPAGGSREFADVLGSSSMFNLSNDYGALLVRSTRKLLVGAHTYTSAAGGGTFGQYAPASDISTEIVAVGETGRFIGIRDDASFRTNLALVNPSSTTCGVQLEVRDSLGQVPASGAKLPVLPPTSMVQVNGIRDFFGITDDIRNASIIVKAVGPNCTVGGTAYVIDRGTNDPYAVPLRK